MQLEVRPLGLEGPLGGSNEQIDPVRTNYSSADELEYTDTEEDEEAENDVLEIVHKELVLLYASLASPSREEDFLESLWEILRKVPFDSLGSASPVVKSVALFVPRVVSCLNAKLKRFGLAVCLFELMCRNSRCVRVISYETKGIRYLLKLIKGDTQRDWLLKLVNCVRSLTDSRHCRQMIVERGGIPILMNLLADQEVEVPVKTQIIRCLRRIFKSTDSREIIAKTKGNGGVKTLVDFFYLIGEDRDTQKNLAGLIQTLATNADIKCALAEADAIPLFVGFLSVNNLHMLKYVICIIRNLACNNDQNRLLIAKSGAIKLLLGLMPVVDIKLKQKIAGALQNLATNKENRLEISTCNGIGVLVSLIQTDDLKLQKYGLGGIKRLVFNSQENTERFFELNGLPSLIKLMDSEDSHVQKNAIHALNRVRLFIGTQHIADLGGVTAMGRLLTSPEQKIRLLAQKNLKLMDQDPDQWLCNMKNTSYDIVSAARILLCSHVLVPSSYHAPPKLQRKKSLWKSGLIKLRLSGESVGEEEPEHGLTPEEVMDELGYSGSYKDLRAYTPYVLPLPVLKLILKALDHEEVLTAVQYEMLFEWAAERKTLSLKKKDLVLRLTNVEEENKRLLAFKQDSRQSSCVMM